MRDVVYPYVVSWLRADVSPGLIDATLLFRYFTVLFNVAFDAGGAVPRDRHRVLYPAGPPAGVGIADQ